jgi:uncharacterized protein (TIGR03067 family)
MKRFILVVLPVGLLVGADNPKKDKGAPALKGTWRIVSARWDGNADDKPKDSKAVFRGTNLTIKNNGLEYELTLKIDIKPGKVQGKVYSKNALDEATFKIDPKTKTYEITFHRGIMGGYTTKGIYQLKGDELKTCTSGAKNPPRDFTCKKGSGHYLIVLKRAKDKEDKKEKEEKELAQVVGTVTLDGKPLAKAKVEFIFQGKGGQKATGTTNKDGTFELTTMGKKGALPGEHLVVITKKVAGKSVLPAKYASAKTSELKVAVVAKVANRVDFNLMSK